MSELVKRKWVYVGQPVTYGYPPCDCGNKYCDFSEYEKHLWCQRCNKDFIPEHYGVFDGPIVFEMCQLLGMNFDTIDLERDIYIVFNGEHHENGDPIEIELTDTRDIVERVDTLARKSQEFLDKSGMEVYDGSKIRLRYATSNPQTIPEAS